MFEASINIALFRKSINEMTKITNEFFDIADSRANTFSDNLDNLGGNFRISEQFDAANRSIYEGASAIDSYNRSLSNTYDTIARILQAAFGIFGVKGIIAGAIAYEAYRADLGGVIVRAIQSEIPFITQELNRAFYLGHYTRAGEAIVESFKNASEAVSEINRETNDEIGRVSMEAINEMGYSWGEFSRGIEQNFDGMVGSHWRMTYEMLDDMRMMGYDWVDFNKFRAYDAEETNRTVAESHKYMADDILKNTMAPLGEKWGGFYAVFEKGAKAANEAARISFENMAEGVSVGAIAKMKFDYDALWERVQEGAGFTSGVIKSFFGSLPDEIRNPINGIIRLVSGMIQRISSGMNTMIDGLNNMGFDLPAWLGGGSFRLNIPRINPPQIPMLARGGIVDRPTLALIGERGKEAVMPLENNTGWIADLANSIGSVVAAQLVINQAGSGNRSGFDSAKPIQLYLDGRKVAEGIMDDFMEVAQRRDIKLVH